MKRGLHSSLASALLAATGGYTQPSATTECAALAGRARSDYEARRFEQAIGDFSAALRVCGPRGDLRLALGEAQLMAGHGEAASKSLRLAVAADPTNVMARKVLGDALYLMGREAEAEESLKAALALDAKFQPALYALGRIHYPQNLVSEAISQFQRLIELDAGNYRAHDNLGLCYEAMHRDSEALRHFLKALELVHQDHPEYDAAHADLAEFFLKRNEFEKAFQLAAEAAARNPSSARNCFLTAKALIGLNKDQLSLRWLERATQLSPDYREAHYQLARAYQRLGRKSDADKEFAIFREVSSKPASRR